jgi:hypothetical protein
MLDVNNLFRECGEEISKGNFLFLTEFYRRLWSNLDGGVVRSEFPKAWLAGLMA